MKHNRHFAATWIPALALACSAVAVGSARAEPITPVIPDVARPLPLGAIRLTGGPLKHAQDLDAKYLLALEPDRMLAGYRLRRLWSPRPKATAAGTRSTASS